MNVYKDEWIWVETIEEWHDMCPEALEAPDEFPVSVQIIEIDSGLLFSVLPCEVGTYLWNSPYEVGFIADFDVDEEEEEKKEDTYH